MGGSIEQLRDDILKGAKPKPINVKLGEAVRELHVAGSAIVDRHASARRSSLDAPRLNDLEEKASEAGFFDDVPWLVPANAAIASTVASKFRHFDGQFGWSVTPATTAAFIAQFPPRLRDELADALQSNFDYIDRSSIATAFVSLISGYQQEVGARVFVVGLTPDSGAHVRQMIEHELKAAWASDKVTFAKSLQHALDSVEPNEAIVFCDDNISSGSQVQCQFRTWFGVPRDQWPEADRQEAGVYPDALLPGQQQKLRNTRFALAYCVGNAAAEKALRPLLVALHVQSFDGLRIKSPLNKTHAVSVPLHDFLVSVGKEVLAFGRYGSGAGRGALSKEQLAFCDASAAGYSDARGLLATSFSVPTATYPAFWCPGFFKGFPWLPLFVRRGYAQRLVIT